MRRMLGVAGLAVGLSAAIAAAEHIHVTVDTQDGQVKIVIGYLFGEESYFIDAEGWMRKDDAYYTITCDHPWQGEPYNGLPIAVEQMTLTSDYYTSTGRLDGGHYLYEMASVVPVDGDPNAAVIWAEEQTGDFLSRIADSSGATRDKRSFELGFAGHIHNQRQLLDTPGLYEVTLIAWDSNGVYADSEPVKFYLQTPACDADFNGDGSVNTQDVLAFLGAWAAGDGSADMNGDGSVNTQDVIAFLNLWAAGC